MSFFSSIKNWLNQAPIRDVIVPSDHNLDFNSVVPFKLYSWTAADTHCPPKELADIFLAEVNRIASNFKKNRPHLQLHIDLPPIKAKALPDHTLFTFKAHALIESVSEMKLGECVSTETLQSFPNISKGPHVPGFVRKILIGYRIFTFNRVTIDQKTIWKLVDIGNDN